MSFNDALLSNAQNIPLSFSQTRIWFLQNLYNDDVMYNTLRCFRIKGRLNMEALHMTLHTLAARHDVLRYRLHLSKDGSPYQVIEKEPEITIEYTDLVNARREDTRDLARQILQEAVVRPFKFYNEPMLRVVFIRLNDSESMLLFVMHHLIADYSAWRLFLSEFAAVYTAKITGHQLLLSPLAWQYSDFAKKQILLLTQENILSHRKYWRDFFSVCSNPGQAVFSPSQCLADKEHPLYEFASQLIPPATIRECKIIAESLKCTLFTIYLAAIALLVSYLYRDSKVILCTANANRRIPGAEQVIGCFFTNVILHLDIRPERKFSELLHEVREKFLHARQNQDIPFEMFAEDLALECTRQSKPPYRIYISYHNSANDIEFNLPSVELERMAFSTGRNTHEDIVFDFWEKLSEGKLSLEIQWLWRNDVYDNEAIKKMTTMLETLFTEIRRNIHGNVQSLQDRFIELDKLPK